MIYYCYNEYDPDSPLADETGGYVVTKSEAEIRSEYWPYWYKRMCDKFGKFEVIVDILLKIVSTIG
jgi:hypothetical protein